MSHCDSTVGVKKVLRAVFFFFVEIHGVNVKEQFGIYFKDCAEFGHAILIHINKIFLSNKTCKFLILELKIKLLIKRYFK